jgi:polysaccharide biosynthesis protein PslE
MLATVAYLITAERKFRSEAKLFVRSGGQALKLPSASSEEQSAGVGDAQQREVYAVAELLQSRLLAEKVVEKFGPETILDKKNKKDTLISEWVSKAKEALSNLDEYNLNPIQKFSESDEAVKVFKKSLKVLPTKTSNVVSMSYDFTDPDIAQGILEFLLKSAMDEHFRIHLTPGSQEFFASQANRLRTTLSDLELRLRDFKNETGLASLEIQRASILDVIGRLEQDHILALTQLDSVEAEARSRREQLERMPVEIVAQRATDQPNSIGQLLRSKVYDLEATEQEQASKLASNHPTLVSTRERLSEARKLIQDEKQSVGITTGMNPNYQATDLAIHEHEATVEGLTTRIKSLSDKLQSARTEVQRLNAAEVDLSELQRDIDLVEVNYRTYSENLEKSRINEELERAKISGLTTMQPPTNSKTPVSPLPLFAFLFGLLASCFASAAWITQSELRKWGGGLLTAFPASSGDAVSPLSDHRVMPSEPSKVILQRVQRKSVLPR